MARWFAVDGTTTLTLPDYASQVEDVTIGGLADDPLDWSLNAVGDTITFATALTAESVITSSYILKVI